MNTKQQAALDRVRERNHSGEDLTHLVSLADALLIRQEADAARIVELEEAERFTLARCHDALRRLGPHQFRSWLDQQCLKVNALTTPTTKEKR